MSILCDSQIRDLCVNVPATFNIYTREKCEVFYSLRATCENVAYTLSKDSKFDDSLPGEWSLKRKMFRLNLRNQLENLPLNTPLLNVHSDIYKIIKVKDNAMISPYLATQKKLGANDEKMISAGQSSHGYDVSLTETVKLFTNLNAAVIDPKRFDESCLVDATVKTDTDGARFVLLPPNSYLLGNTIETFCIPRNVMVICLGKSTYARSGVVINTTPIEAGFTGTVVIEVANSTTLPVKIYLNEGIAQFLFFESDEECETSYADRAGKYQGQTGITFSKV